MYTCAYIYLSLYIHLYTYIYIYSSSFSAFVIISNMFFCSDGVCPAMTNESCFEVMQIAHAAFLLM